jgi:hypothetical protein
MRLTSCDECAVILDGDKLNFPFGIYGDNDRVDPNKGAYNQRTGEYSAYVECPVCKSKIFEDNL